MDKVGEKVKKLRKDAGLTLADLSRSSGLTAAGISYIERGLRSPKEETILKLATALNVHPASLWL